MTKRVVDSGDFDEPVDKGLDDGAFDGQTDDVPTAVGKNKLVPGPIIPLDLPFSDDDFEDEVPTLTQAAPLLKGEE